MRRILLNILTIILFSSLSFCATTSVTETKPYETKTMAELFENFYTSTGVYAFFNAKDGLLDSNGKEISNFSQTAGRAIMIVVCLFLLYLAKAKGFEPLLLIPIGFGGILANIPIANIGGDTGFLGIIYNMGISTGLFPIIIFMGVGAMTDFGPLLANPKTSILGGAAQFGIFITLVGAMFLTDLGIFNFSLQDASAIGIIGGADGPTAIFIASRLAPDLLGAIAVAAYSYMALVPIIQPPIMYALTTKEERAIKMTQVRRVSQLEKNSLPNINAYDMYISSTRCNSLNRCINVW